MASGWVVHQKHDSNGNMIGRYNKNPILDTCVYEVAFSWGEITELAGNIIAESMYAQCDVDGDEYLYLEAFVNHRKSSSALSVKGQKIVVKGKETLRNSTAGWNICCKWIHIMGEIIQS